MLNHMGIWYSGHDNVGHDNVSDRQMVRCFNHDLNTAQKVCYLSHGLENRPLSDIFNTGQLGHYSNVDRNN